MANNLKLKMFSSNKTTFNFAGGGGGLPKISSKKILLLIFGRKNAPPAKLFWLTENNKGENACSSPHDHFFFQNVIRKKKVHPL